MGIADVREAANDEQESNDETKQANQKQKKSTKH